MARMRSVFETTFLYQGLMTPDGILLDANPTSLAGIEARLEDVVGKPFWETPWFTGTAGMPEQVAAAVRAVAAGQTCDRNSWSTCRPAVVPSISPCARYATRLARSSRSFPRQSIALNAWTPRSSYARFRRWRRSASSPAVSRTTSTICSPASVAAWNCWRGAWRVARSGSSAAMSQRLRPPRGGQRF